MPNSSSKLQNKVVIDCYEISKLLERKLGDYHLLNEEQLERIKWILKCHKVN